MSLKLSATIAAEDKHDYDVTALVFEKDKLYSASDDGKIKVWSPDLKLLHQKVTHPCSIYSLATDGSTIYSCSNDGTVKAWDLDHLEDRGTVCTSEREFWKLYWNKGTLYIVNDLGNIIVFKDGKATGEIQTLEQIKDIAVIDQLVFTVRDLDLSILEQCGEKSRGRTMSCRTLCGRAPLCVAGDMLCYSSRDGRSLLINYNKKDHQFKEIAEIKNVSEKLINAVTATVVNGKTHVYCGGWDNNIRQFLVTAAGHEVGPTLPLPSYVNVLTVTSDGKVVYAAGGDGNIWKIDYNV